MRLSHSSLGRDPPVHRVEVVCIGGQCSSSLFLPFPAPRADLRQRLQPRLRERRGPGRRRGTARPARAAQPAPGTGLQLSECTARS